MKATVFIQLPSLLLIQVAWESDSDEESDEDSDEEEKLAEGHVKVQWLGCRNSEEEHKKLVVVDRALLPSDVVTRVNDTEGLQFGL